MQILGDLSGNVTHLGECECSVQRRFQKVIEVAPATCAGRHGALQDYRSRHAFCEKWTTPIGHVEFLVNATGQSGAQSFVFIETNARLQVEHIVTEEVTGLDLVQAQILLAQGSTLKELGLYREPTNARLRIQARVNMQTMCADGGGGRPGECWGRDPWSGSFLLHGDGGRLQECEGRQRGYWWRN
jgi:pyruvate carboxylase